MKLQKHKGQKPVPGGGRAERQGAGGRALEGCVRESSGEF